MLEFKVVQYYLFSFQKENLKSLFSIRKTKELKISEYLN
jgi:hypothetical protein